MEELGSFLLKQRFKHESYWQAVYLKDGGTLKAVGLKKYRITVPSAGNSVPSVEEWGTAFDLASYMPFESVESDSELATMELVLIPHNPFSLYDTDIDMSKLKEMLARSLIDPCYLGLGYGLSSSDAPQEFMFSERMVKDDNGTEHVCYSFILSYPGNARYLVWSFEPHSLTTRGIFITSWDCTMFFKMLKVFLKYIHSPYVLGVCHAYFVAFEADSTYGLQNNKKAIERSENATGHAIKYPYLLAKPDLEHNYCGTVLTSADLNDIAAGVAKAALDLREAEQCIHSLDSFFRHMSKEDALFQHPTDKLQVAQQSTSYGNTTHSTSTATRALMEVAKMAKAQADAQLNYMDWWDSRAKNQQTVLFNLMTHYDSKASLELAEIMRKDSASMKTVAVMTMTFLPATFLAAVFALPSLKWPENKPNSVIQDGFGLYWGISVATTAAVFATWYFATRRIVGQSADQSAKAESRLSGLIAKVKLGLSGPKKDSDSDPGPGSGSDPKPDSRRRDIPLQKLREIKDNMRQTVEGLRNGHTGQFLDVENLKNKVKQKMHSRKTDSVQQSHSTVAEQIVPESSTSVENPGVPTGNNPPGLGIRRRNTSGSEPQSLNGVKGRSGQVGHIEDKSGGSAEASSKIVSLREVVVNAEL